MSRFGRSARVACCYACWARLLCPEWTKCLAVSTDLASKPSHPRFYLLRGDSPEEKRRDETNGRGFPRLARRPSTVAYTDTWTALQQPCKTHAGRTLFLIVAKMSPRRPYGGALLVASEQRSKLGLFGLQACIHTRPSLLIHSPHMGVLFALTKYTLVRVPTPLLPWLFARSLLRYRRSDSACVFSHARRALSAPPLLI